MSMQRALRQWTGHASNLEHPISLSIGMNTGRAALGNMGSSLRLDHTVIGDAVNVAARIQDIAPTGAILAGPETVRQTGERFRWRSLGHQALRGRAESVEVFDLLGDA